MATAPADGSAVFAGRRRALLERAAGRGAKAVLAFGHGSALGAGTQSHGALRYLCGWDGRESPSLLVITAEATHLLVGSPFMMPLAQTLRRDLVLHDLRPAAWAGMVGTLVEEGAGTVGFGEMPARIHGLFGPLAQGLALDEELSRQRLLKDDAAIANHRTAAKLCDMLFRQLGSELARRIPAWQVQLELEMAARRAGADYCRTWLTVLPQADFCRYWREEALQVPQIGDQVALGVALTVEGHWGHGIRMGSIGPQKPEHKVLVDHVEAMLEAGLSALQPGAPLGGVEAAMEREFDRRRIKANYPGLRRFRSGHGLGFSYEDPLLTDAFRQHFDPTAPAASPPVIALAPGMLFELHPNLFVPGVGGAALGEMVLITEDGPLSMLDFPRQCVEWT